MKVDIFFLVHLVVLLFLLLKVDNNILHKLGWSGRFGDTGTLPFSAKEDWKHFCQG